MRVSVVTERGGRWQRRGRASRGCVCNAHEAGRGLRERCARLRVEAVEDSHGGLANLVRGGVAKGHHEVAPIEGEGGKEGEGGVATKGRGEGKGGVARTKGIGNARVLDADGALAHAAVGDERVEQLQPAQRRVLALGVGQRAQRVRRDRGGADARVAREAEERAAAVLARAHVGRAGARHELRREEVDRRGGQGLRQLAQPRGGEGLLEQLQRLRSGGAQRKPVSCGGPRQRRRARRAAGEIVAQSAPGWLLAAPGGAERARRGAPADRPAPPCPAAGGLAR